MRYSNTKDPMQELERQSTLGSHSRQHRQTHESRVPGSLKQLFHRNTSDNPLTAEQTKETVCRWDAEPVACSSSSLTSCRVLPHSALGNLPTRDVFPQSVCSLLNLEQLYVRGETFPCDDEIYGEHRLTNWPIFRRSQNPNKHGPARRDSRVYREPHETHGLYGSYQLSDWHTASLHLEPQST